MLLEKADGSHDKVTAAELADLLDLARDHLKLVTVSARSWRESQTPPNHRDRTF